MLDAIVSFVVITHASPVNERPGEVGCIDKAHVTRQSGLPLKKLFACVLTKQFR